MSGVDYLALVIVAGSVPFAGAARAEARHEFSDRAKVPELGVMQWGMSYGKSSFQGGDDKLQRSHCLFGTRQAAQRDIAATAGGAVIGRPRPMTPEPWR